MLIHTFLLTLHRDDVISATSILPISQRGSCPTDIAPQINNLYLYSPYKNVFSSAEPLPDALPDTRLQLP